MPNSGGRIKQPVVSSPVGAVEMFAGRSAPARWKLCDGSAISRATYARLYTTLVPTIGTFTITLATPAVVTLNGHGFVASDRVFFTTTGALPTGVSANTIYYVLAAGLTVNTFRFSLSDGGAAINSSVSQSGTHTLFACPWGLGDGSTTFNVPDMRGRAPIGVGTGTTLTNRVAGLQIGEETHVLTTAELATHTHVQNSHTHTDSGHNHGLSVTDESGPGGTPHLVNVGSFTGTTNASDVQSSAANITATTAINQNAGSDTAHNNMQPSVALNFIIRAI